MFRMSILQKDKKKTPTEDKGDHHSASIEFVHLAD